MGSKLTVQLEVVLAEDALHSEYMGLADEIAKIVQAHLEDGASVTHEDSAITSAEAEFSLRED